MIKKLTLLAMAIGALVAFAVPAVAAAEEPVLTVEEEAVEVGSTVTATNDPSNPVITEVTGVGTLSCQIIDVTIEVTANTENVAEGEGEGFAANCTLNGNPSGAVEIPNASIVLSEGGGSATFSFTYLGGACSLSGTVPLSYVSESSTVTLGNGTGDNLKGSAGCPPAARISGSLILDEGVTIM